LVKDQVGRWSKFDRPPRRLALGEALHAAARGTRRKIAGCAVLIARVELDEFVEAGKLD
jgi:hypothetical protein